MAPARLLVASHERLLGRLEEQHVVAQAERVEVVDDRAQRLEVDAAADVGDDGRALDLRTLVDEQLDQRADHRRREVVYAEVAGVIEHVHRGRLARAREAGDHDEILQARLAVPLARSVASRTLRRGPDHGHHPYCAANRGHGAAAVLVLVKGGLGLPEARPPPQPARWRWPKSSRPTLAGTPGTAASSSLEAATTASGEPKCASRARLRAGPMPGSSSSSEVVIARSRRVRWWVIAKRWASSRTRWSSCSAGVA